ncbi:MAG: 3'-5' exonuclease [Firmicutes bacterium]|nr:3'-5' exonuclease [Bacillota bacterium]
MGSNNLLFNMLKSLGQGSMALARGKSVQQPTAGRFGLHDPEVPLREQCFVVVDCETTGLKQEHGDRVISLAAVRLIGGEVDPDRFSTLIDPQRPVPELATSITGIDDQMLAGQPRLEEILPQFLDFARGGIITGYNVGFDLAFLNPALRSAGRDALCAAHSLDVFVLGRILHPHWRHRSLEDMARAYGIPVEGRHTALGDSLMTVRLLKAMFPQLEQRGIKNLRDLADFLCYCSLY